MDSEWIVFIIFLYIMGDYDLSIISEEAKNLAGINDRFENESVLVQSIRYDFWLRFTALLKHRDDAWRSEAGRNFSLAITHLEDACIRFVKGVYSVAN